MSTTDPTTDFDEIAALKAEIERRRARRHRTLDSLDHLVETIRNLSTVMHRVGINATIEAARAGKSGAPFSVIASEIKSLATVMKAASEEAGALLKDRDDD